MFKCRKCKKEYVKTSKTIYYCSPECLLLDSFEENERGCWIWKKAKGKDGYGRIRFQNHYFRVHRFSYEILTKNSPGNLHVLHKCDTPLCINPDHLFLGTNNENMRDKIDKGRERYYHKFTVEQVLEIRKLHKEGITQYKIAKLFKCTHGHIWLIVHRKIWKHI